VRAVALADNIDYATLGVIPLISLKESCPAIPETGDHTCTVRWNFVANGASLCPVGEDGCCSEESGEESENLHSGEEVVIMDEWVE
jgi:hypothetical protein